MQILKFCVSVKVGPHLDKRPWVPISWTLMMLDISSLGAIWNFIKRQDSHDLDFRLRCQKVCKNGLQFLGPIGLEPIVYSVPFTHTTHFH